MTTRIYLVESKTGDKTLVEASNHAEALRHVTKGTFTSKVPTTLEVAAIISAGGKLEKAGSDDATGN